MELDINWEDKSVDEKEQQELSELLEAGILETLISGGGPQDAEIGLVLVDDKTIHHLNKSYRGVDRPTDVLSFALQEKGEGEPDIHFDPSLDGQEGDNVLGDIVISVETAHAQAKEYGHSFAREIVYLAVHGTLHLLGYDHIADEQSSEMRQKEEQVLEKLGLSR